MTKWDRLTEKKPLLQLNQFVYVIDWRVKKTGLSGLVWKLYFNELKKNIKMLTLLIPSKT